MGTKEVGRGSGHGGGIERRGMEARIALQTPGPRVTGR